MRGQQSLQLQPERPQPRGPGRRRAGRGRGCLREELWKLTGEIATSAGGWGPGLIQELPWLAVTSSGAGIMKADRSSPWGWSRRGEKRGPERPAGGGKAQKPCRAGCTELEGLTSPGGSGAGGAAPAQESGSPPLQRLLVAGERSKTHAEG